jgi:hypothetical protein
MIYCSWRLSKVLYSSYCKSRMMDLKSENKDKVKRTRWGEGGRETTHVGSGRASRVQHGTLESDRIAMGVQVVLLSALLGCSVAEGRFALDGFLLSIIVARGREGARVEADRWRYHRRWQCRWGLRGRGRAHHLFGILRPRRIGLRIHIFSWWRLYSTSVIFRFRLVMSWSFWRAIYWLVEYSTCLKYEYIG